MRQSDVLRNASAGQTAANGVYNVALSVVVHVPRQEDSPQIPTDSQLKKLVHQRILPSYAFLKSTKHKYNLNIRNQQCDTRAIYC